MAVLNLDQVQPLAARNIKPFLDEILAAFAEKIHSIHITGTAVTDDFDETSSDVNSVVVLKRMDLQFLELLAPLGKKYGKHKVAAPLIMTPEYIDSSLDVFPIEFLNIKLIHATVVGADIFRDLTIGRMDLRHQCERDLKAKLIWIRQTYLSAQGDRKLLAGAFADSISGYVPLFRGIISLFQKSPPIRQIDVVELLESETGVNTDVFARLLRQKHQQVKLSIGELNTIFEDFYAATEKLSAIVDEIKE